MLRIETLDREKAGDLAEAEMESRVPSGARALALLSMLLLGGAAWWIWTTSVRVVVPVIGAVRSSAEPFAVRFAGNGDAVAGSAGSHVVEVFFQPDQRVERGAVLLRLDGRAAERGMRLAQSKAEALAARIAGEERGLGLEAEAHAAERRQVEAEIAHARKQMGAMAKRREADRAAAAAELEEARTSRDRMRRLVGVRAVPQKEYEEAEAKLRVAEAKLARVSPGSEEEKSVLVLERKLALAEASWASRRSKAEQAAEALRAERREAMVEVERWSEALRHCEIRAGCSGTVTSRRAWQAGETIRPLDEVATVTPYGPLCFEGQVPAEKAGRLEAGQAVRVEVRTFSRMDYGVVEGTVESVSRDAVVEQGKSFYKVRVALSRESVGHAGREGKLALGQTGTAEVRIAGDSLWRVLRRNVEGWLRLE
ncbi:MAG: HlyD family secretion protein [Gemmataceae bacterium]|nr:HlyD family secretion protein [Gemmataceae bacterium]